MFDNDKLCKLLAPPMLLIDLSWLELIKNFWAHAKTFIYTVWAAIFKIYIYNVDSGMHGQKIVILLLHL